MTDVTGGPSGRDPLLRPESPRQPRVSEVRAAAERTLATPPPPRAGRRAGIKAEEASLLADGLDTFQAKSREFQAWSTRQTAASRETVRLHPFTSCAATFGAGVLFGIMLMRR